MKCQSLECGSIFACEFDEAESVNPALADDDCIETVFEAGLLQAMAPVIMVITTTRKRMANLL
jgi:hypothetical protein